MKKGFTKDNVLDLSNFESNHWVMWKEGEKKATVESRKYLLFKFKVKHANHPNSFCFVYGQQKLYN